MAKKVVQLCTGGESSAVARPARDAVSLTVSASGKAKYECSENRCAMSRLLLKIVRFKLCCEVIGVLEQMLVGRETSELELLDELHYSSRYTIPHNLVLRAIARCAGIGPTIDKGRTSR